jgi:hypothetical protein
MSFNGANEQLNHSIGPVNFESSNEKSLVGVISTRLSLQCVDRDCTDDFQYTDQKGKWSQGPSAGRTIRPLDRHDLNEAISIPDSY